MRKQFNLPLSNRCVYALAFLVLVFTVQLSLKPVTNLRFLLLYPTIFSISWLWGFIPAILAILLSASGVYLLLPVTKLLGSTEYVTIIVYVTSNMLIAWMMEKSRQREDNLQEEMTSILENMQDTFASCDRNMNITMVNKAHLQLTKTKREDNIGRNLWELFPQVPGSKYEKELTRVLKDRVSVEFEEYYPPLDIWTETSAYPIANGGIAIFSTDITSRKKVQGDLERTEERLLTLANNIPQLAWMTNDEGKMIWHNKRWTEYTGIEYEIGNIDLEKILHPAHAKRIVENFQKHLDEKKLWEDILPLRGKEGYYRWFLSRAVPVTNERGGFLGWFGTNTDIDDQVKIEQQLHQSQRQFQLMADSIPHIVWTAEANGFLDFYNKRYFDYTGQDENLPIIQSWECIIHPDDYQKTLGVWNHSLRTGLPYQVEYRLKEHTGKYRWYLGLALPFKDEENAIVKWFGSCTDIHDQKMLAFELENALRTRDEFLSIASHELKTPLTSLRLNSQMFQRTASKGIAMTHEKMNTLAYQVDKQVSKLNHLVDDMLDISRIRTGKLILRPVSFELLELISDVTTSMKRQFEGEGQSVPAVESNSESIPVFLDRVRIEQVLINLLSNALRYGNKKAVELEIHANQKEVKLSLKDHGIGIAPENLELIFDRFEKIRNPTEISGLGLGLYISKQIILSHGGKIWAESQLGRGSTFHIILPLKVPGT